MALKQKRVPRLMKNSTSKIRGKDGKMHSANIVVVVQKDNIEKPWRLITIKPGKKDK